MDFVLGRKSRSAGRKICRVICRRSMSCLVQTETDLWKFSVFRFFTVVKLLLKLLANRMSEFFTQVCMT